MDLWTNDIWSCWKGAPQPKVESQVSFGKKGVDLGVE